MKKIIAENRTDALVIDELPKVKPIIQPAKKAVSEDSGDDTDSSLVDETLAKRKSLLKNISKSSHSDALKGVTRWQQQTRSLENKLIAHTIPSNDLMERASNDNWSSTRLPFEIKPSMVAPAKFNRVASMSQLASKVPSGLRLDFRAFNLSLSVSSGLVFKEGLW